jgi:hypothetical protein
MLDLLEELFCPIHGLPAWLPMFPAIFLTLSAFGKHCQRVLRCAFRLTTNQESKTDELSKM